MHWLFSHPYRIGIFAACLAAVGMIFVVVERSSVEVKRDTVAWGGRAVPLNPQGYGQAKPKGLNDDEIGSLILSSQLEAYAPFSYTPSVPLAQEGSAPTDMGVFDFDTLIRALVAKNPAPGESGVSGDEGGWGDAFSFIPGGLVATTAPQQNQTPRQRTLYEYGNRVGAEIQSFEDSWPNAIQILYDQAQDRNDAAKAAAAERYARAFAELGVRLLDVGEVPSQAKAAHDALAASYQEAGKNLEMIPKARSDNEVLDAVLTYNASMDTFTEHFVNLALLFSANGVTFGAEDPGSVFSFRPVSF